MSKKRNHQDVRIVITGVGTINPIGNTVEEFWKNLIEKKSGVRRIQSFDYGDYPVQIAGEIDLPDITHYFRHQKMRKRLDRYIILAYVAGCQAITDSGLDIDSAPERYGVLIGTGDAGLLSHNEQITRILKTGMGSASPFYVVNAIPNTATAFLSQEWNLKGPSFTINSACATGNHSIGTAAMMIKSGMADAMITGGSEAVVSSVAIAAFGNIMALSTRNDDPETASRPFDKDRDGFILAEGAGVICIEELEHAKARGAQIYAELSGVGFSSDAYDLVAPHPEAEGAARAIQLALDDAELNTEDIDLINCHGTSTPMGDLIESKAIAKTFKNYSKEVLSHSTKSMTGHLIGGAGTVEIIADIPALQKGLVHATANLFEQDPEIHLNVVKDTMEGQNIRHLITNGFGFGGHNASLVVSRFDG